LPLSRLALSGRPRNCHLSCSQAAHPSFLCRTRDDVDANRSPPLYFMRTFLLSAPLPISSERDSSNIKPLNPTRVRPPFDTLRRHRWLFSSSVSHVIIASSRSASMLRTSGKSLRPISTL